MSNPFDQFDAPASEGSNPFDQFDAPAKKQNKGIAGDLVTDIKRGVEQLPGIATGLADIPVAAVTGKPLVGQAADALGGITGFAPSKWAKEAEAEYSPGRKAAKQAVDQAWEDNETPFADAAGGDFTGIGQIAKSYIQNPQHLVGSVVESLPSMVIGAKAGQLATKAAGIAAPTLAAAGGEGAVMAGQQMDQLSQTDADPRAAAAASAVTGIAGGAIGALGGKVAQKMGVIDPDVAMAGGALRGVTDEAKDQTIKGMVKEGAKRVAGGAVSEGAFEELPQSVLEQVLSNLAQSKPWDEGVSRAAVEGTLAGALMGGAFNAMPPKQEKKTDTPPASDQTKADQPMLALPAPTYTGTPGDQIIANDAERQAAIDKAQAESDAIWAARDEYERQQAEYKKRPMPTIINDPEPIQQRIDALMGINEARLQGFARTNYEKALENAFGEQVGVVVGKDGHEVPFTMGDYLKSKVAVADIGRKQQGKSAPNPAPAAPAIPVVGPLSAAANLAVQSGAHAATVAQQQAAIQNSQAEASNTKPGKADTPTTGNREAAPQAGILAGIAAQAPSIAPAPNTQPQGEGGTPATAQQSGTAAASPAEVKAPASNFDVSNRTDTQLNYLTQHGKPGWKEAAAAELQKRGVQVGVSQQAKSDTLATAGEAKTNQQKIDDLNAQRKPLVDQWNALTEQYKQADEAGKAQLRPQMDAIKAKLAPLDAEGRKVQAAAFKELSDYSAKAHAAENKKRNSALPIGTRVGVIGHEQNDSVYWEKTGPDEWTRNGIGSAKPTVTNSAMDGVRKISSPADVTLTNKGDTQQATEPKTETPEPASDIQRDRNGYAKVGGYYVTPYEDKFVVRESSGTIHRVDGKQVGFASEQEAIDYAKGVSSKPAPKAPTEGGPEDSIGWTRMTIVEREGLLIRAGYGGKGRALNLGGAGAINRSWENMGKGIREKLIAAHEVQFKPADQNPVKNETPANTGDSAQTTEKDQAQIKKPSDGKKDESAESLAREMAGFTGVSDIELALRQASHSEKQEGDIELGNGKFITLEQAVSAAKQHMDPADWSKPFQFNRVLDIAPVDWNRMVEAMKSATADPVSQQKADAAPEAKQEAAPASDADARFAKNTIFTADKVAAARERMKKKLGTMNSGIDPELLIDGMTIAGAYIESGVRKFGDYAKAMVADLGEGVKPYLLSFYEAARAYPGLNKLGMDSQESAAQQHQALLTPEVKESAKEVIGESPKVEKKKPANLGEAVRLKADWGVQNIDGYTRSKTGKNQETDFGLKGGVKDEFINDARRYLNRVADLLKDKGFTVRLNSKGKPESAVHTNEAGPAVSGDVSLEMRKGDYGIYATVGVSSIRGASGVSHPQGVALMVRVTPNAETDRYATKGMNHWLPVDLSAGDLAAWFDNGSAMIEKPAAPAKLEVKESTNENAQPAEPGKDGAGVSGIGTSGTVSTPVAEQGTGGRSAEQGGSGNGVVPGSNGPVVGGSQSDESGRQGKPGSRPGAVSDHAGKPDRGVGTESNARIPQRSDGRVNYQAPVGALERTGSWLDTAKRNIEIIKLIKSLETDGRVATPEQQALIAQYVGFGASEIANGLFPVKYDTVRSGRSWKRVATGDVDESALKPGWKEVYFALKDAVSDQELKEIQASTQFAHYTSEKVIRSIWSAVSRFGFNGGKIIEPGMGTGLFMVAAPQKVADTSRYVGIERDGITSAIAKQLLQGQNIIKNSYIDQNLPDNNFDMAIGNPPFAGWKVTADPRYKKFGFLLHDYFFAKTIDKVRPGGILVFVTSKGTMDKEDDKARAYLAERADLLGAIRLPQTAFKGNAGTEVVTDVLFLRKREAGQAPSDTAWAGLKEVETPQGPTKINQYFADHPEMVLGRNELVGSMYRANEYTVTPLEGDIEEHFAKAIDNLPKDVYQNASAVKHGAEAGIQKKSDRQDFNVANKKEGGLYIADDGELMQVVEGVGVPISNIVSLNDKEKAWLKDYVPLRDALKQAMLDQIEDGDWEKSLAALKKSYAEFKKKHGRILEHTTYEREFENDAGDVETRVYKRFKWNKLLGSNIDVETTLVQGLEAINDNNSDVVDGGILVNGRVLARRAEAEIKTVNDAFAVTLNSLGHLDIPRIAELMGLTEDQAIVQLGDLIYEHPVAGWQTADEYLSGDVLKKLEEAEVAAAIEPRYERNVQALIKVQPAPLGPDRIVVRLGANWISPEVVTQFANEALDEDTDVTYEPRTNRWTVAGENLRRSRTAGAEWGTADRSVTEILSSVLNNESITVRRTDSETKKTWVDKDATAKANDIAEKMRQRFSSWVWTDASRTESLLSIYNRKFNNLAPRAFDGKHLTLPGLSMRYKLYDHQLRAIWRIVQTGNTYLDHAVGAGKTLEMIVSSMEQKRLGLISKPMFVVPNHMLEQFANEFQEAYPAARILVADKENFIGDQRRRFVAKAALNDWDAVIIKQSSFGLIGISQETADSVADDMLDELQSALDDTEKDDRVTRKKLEAQIEGVRQRVSSMVGKGDGNVTFEQLGVDFLYVDEAHTYRKLDYATNRQVKGIDPNGSKGAFGMFAKMRYLDTKRPGRSAVMASGTPVTNTIAELYTIQRFLDYNGLREDGLHAFDAWANNFGAVGAEWERNAAGEFEKVERFSKFVNVPELMQRVRKFMDVLTMEQLGDYVVRPNLKGGQPEMVTAEKSDALERYMTEILLPRLEESKKWKPTKDQPYNPDPVIAIGTDGRLAAIDARFAYPSMKDDPGSKLNMMIDNIISEYKATANNTYTTDGKQDKIKGGTQIIFSAVGFGANVEQNRGFSPRKWMLERLKKAGIPSSEVAFMSDYTTDKQKETMFKEMREGKKRILVGSPANMGTGVNVQKRLTSLHFMAPPWYPADVEQPHGRILRQGNQNKEVAIKWYVTAGTYDSTMWGMVRRKGQAIEQAFRGDGARTIEDISEVSAYAMAEAVAAGDDRVIKLAEAQANVEKFQRLKNAHFAEQQILRSNISSLEADARSNRADILKFEKAAEAQKEANYAYWKDLAVTIGGQSFIKSGEVGDQLGAKVAEAFKSNSFSKHSTPIASVLGKFDIVANYTPAASNYSKKEEISLDLDVAPALIRISPSLTLAEWAQQDAVGLGQRVSNAMRRVEENLREAKRDLEEAEKQLAKKRPLLGTPFADESALAQAIAEAASLQAELVGESIKKQQDRAAENTETPEGAGNIAERNASLSPADTAVYGMVAEGKSAADILKFIASASRNPMNRQLAKLLLKTGIAPQVMASTAAGWKFNAGNDKKYAAAYNQSTDTIALFRAPSAERNFLHEAMHAATIRALSKKGMAAAQMKALFEHVKKAGDLKGMYGMSDIDEFVAEAFSNPKFQESLKRIAAPKASSGTLASAWQWFVRIVRGILGVPHGQENALSQAIEIGLGVMREDIAERNPRGGIDYSKATPAERKDALMTMAATGLDDPSLDGMDKAAIRAEVSRRFKAFKDSPVTALDGRAIHFNGVGLREMRAHSADIRTMLLANKAPELMRKAIPLFSREHERRTNMDSIVAWHYYGAKVEHEGKTYFARIVAREAVNGSIYYDNDLSTVEDVNGRAVGAYLTKTGAAAVSADKHSLANWMASIKPERIKYNAANGQQSQINSPEFKRWFGKSMVVDEDGNPQVMYHATNRDFTTFDRDASKAWRRIATMDNVGSWFSDSPNEAGKYIGDQEGAQIVPVYLKIERPKVYESFNDFLRDMHAAAGTKYDERNAPGRGDPAPLRNKLQAQGYDGIAFQKTENQDLHDRMPVLAEKLRQARESWQQADKADRKLYEWIINETMKAQKETLALIKESGGSTEFDNQYVWVAFEPGQIKSSIENNGQFDEGNPDVRYNIADEGWSVSEPSKMDDVIYALQDKQIDMKRVVQAIMGAGKKIRDAFNPYLQEELFHGRAAKGVKDFLDFELRPLLAEMNKAGIDMGDFEEYLWNRHAPERNAQIAKINPDMPDSGSGIATADAMAYLAGLSAEQKAKYEALAKRIDAINASSQKILVNSGLENQSTIDAWNGAYQHYVPLQREDVDSGHVGTGKGFSVRGSSSKRAMGSGKKVVDIIANIAMQRERNIVRAEKNRVSNALMGLAMENPNPDFWKVDQAPKERVVNNVAIYNVLDSDGNKVADFTNMDEADRMARRLGGEVEQTWGDRVQERIEPGFKNRDNVLLTRVNGKDHYIIFNERDERAMRMATAMKNLDVDNLGRVLSVVGKATRYLSSINTQYNPVFGVINLIRDAQGALINLSSTALAGEQKRVLGYTKDALVGIYRDIRAHRAGKVPSSNWAALFEEFQKEGGQTGYRDQYANAEARAESIKSELEQFKEGKAKQLTRGLFGWLSDYNETMENAVRLAAYKAAKEKGMSKQQAASLAKNITVNFNRKGQMATQVGALYAFFNASVQGTARIAETLFEQHGGDFKNVRLSKKGKQIVLGGIMLGSMQAMLLAAAGFGDDEPPDFVKERNLILPIGDGKYLTLAMPLGMHVIPGIGRLATEFVMNGGKDPIKKIAAMGSMFAEAFNPVGNSGWSLQTITPSVVDPFAALAENRDFTGKEIYREDFNKLNPTPGHARAKDVATVWSRYISEAINFITGGTEFKPGMFSPSPDSIDYLIAQVFGGVGREVNKVAQTIGATSSGEDLPLYKVPLVGRFVGDTEGQSGQSAKFYDAIKQINMHEAEYKGLLKDGRRQEAMEYMAENPAVKLIMAGNHAETMVRKLRNMKRDLVDEDASKDQIRAVDERITATMRAFNERAMAAI